VSAFVTARSTASVKNGWHHLALTQHDRHPQRRGQDAWHVMHNGTNANQFTRGRADEVAAYNRALTATELQQHYQAGRG
jgi:hypothetical protein